MECVCGREMTRHDWKNQWVCHRCGRTKPIVENFTNAERLRDMTDEELAQFFSRLICDINEGVEYHENPNTWLEWLQQPAEDY